MCFFFPVWLWPLYGFYLNRFSALLFWSDGCNWYQTGVFHSFHIRSLKKQSFLLLTNSHIPNCGLQKNADGHMVKLGWPASGAALPEMNWIFLWIKLFYLVTTLAPTYTWANRSVKGSVWHEMKINKLLWIVYSLGTPESSNPFYHGLQVIMRCRLPWNH